jgi:hypothetical protein
MRSPRFVPRIVFTTALASVVPACHGASPLPDVIVLAVQGFTGGASTTSNGGGASNAGTTGNGGGASNADTAGNGGGTSNADTAGSGGGTSNAGAPGGMGAPVTTVPSTSAAYPVPSASGPVRPHIIVLAVQGFSGKKPHAAPGTH